MSHAAWFMRSARLLTTLLIILTAASSCRKPDADLGNGLLPGDPLGLVIDTVELHAHTRVDTNFRSSSLSRQLLGSFVDPRFGTTRAGLVTQVRLTASNIVDVPDLTGLVADSIVLALAFDGANYAYGNLDPQVFRVHELDERLSIDSIYRSNREPAIAGPDLMARRGGLVKPEPLRKPYILGDSLDPQLRLRLSDALAQRFLQAFNTDAFASDNSFLDFFNGLYITVDNPGQAPYQGGLLYFNLLSTASRLVFYYRDTNSAEPNLTHTLDFPINSNCVRYSVIEHDRTQAIDPGFAAALADTMVNAERIYVQALAGTRAVIGMPSLSAFRDQPFVLAKAELVMHVDGSIYPYHQPPGQLILFRRNAAGNEAFLPDLIGGIGALDGNYRNEEREYRFNITRFVLGAINGEYDPQLEVIPGSGGVTGNRTVLRGSAAAEDAMRLRLTFTSY